MLGGGGRLGMLFFCELYVIRDELALLGRTAHHPRSWASTSYNYNRSWASTSYKYNYQLPATCYQPHAACSGGHLPLPIDYRRQRTRSGTPSPSARCCHLLTAKLRTRHEAKCVRSRRVSGGRQLVEDDVAWTSWRYGAAPTKALAIADGAAYDAPVSGGCCE